MAWLIKQIITFDVDLFDFSIVSADIKYCGVQTEDAQD